MRETLAEAPPAAAGVETITAPPALPSKDVATVRNLAVDAYRGLVMLLMMGEVLSFSKVSAYFNHSVFWKVLAWNQTHTEWFGCSLHDMIQPSFSFLVGVALPYSIRSRQRKGTSFPKMLGSYHLAIVAADRCWASFSVRSTAARQTSPLKTR